MREVCCVVDLEALAEHTKPAPASKDKLPFFSFFFGFVHCVHWQHTNGHSTFVGVLEGRHAYGKKEVKCGDGL